MSNNDNGQPSQEEVEKRETVAPAAMRFGDLMKAFITGMLNRERFLNSLQMAQMMAQQDPRAQQDLRFQAQVKEDKKQFELATHGCKVIVAELNERFKEVDAARAARVNLKLHDFGLANLFDGEKKEE